MLLSRKLNMELKKSQIHPSPKGKGLLWQEDKMFLNLEGKIINKNEIETIEIGEFISEYPSATEAARYVGGRIDAIAATARGFQKTSAGFIYNHPIFRQCLNILDKYEDSPEAMLRIIVDLIAIIDEKQKIINSRYI